MEHIRMGKYLIGNNNVEIGDDGIMSIKRKYLKEEEIIEFMNID